MKTHNFIIGAGALLLFASCETSRQTLDSAPESRSSFISTTNVSPASAQRNSGNTMNSTSPVSASAADPMLNTPAAVASANTSAISASSVNTNTVAYVPATIADTVPKVSTTRTVIVAPQEIESRFKTQFPNASNVRWYHYNSADVPIDWELTGWPTLTASDYAVMYNVDNMPFYAWYDVNGNWVGSTSQMSDYANLPAPVSQLLSSKYAGYTISEVHAETYKNQSGYEIEMAKGTDRVKMVVDANGNILKQKTKTTDADGKVIKEKIKN